MTSMPSPSSIDPARGPSDADLAADDAATDAATAALNAKRESLTSSILADLLGALGEAWVVGKPIAVVALNSAITVALASAGVPPGAAPIIAAGVRALEGAVLGAVDSHLAANG